MGSGVSRRKLVYTEWIDEFPLYSTGSSNQHPVISHNEKEHEKVQIYD